MGENTSRAAHLNDWNWIQGNLWKGIDGSFDEICSLHILYVKQSSSCICIFMHNRSSSVNNLLLTVHGLEHIGMLHNMVIGVSNCFLFPIQHYCFIGLKFLSFILKIHFKTDSHKFDRNAHFNICSEIPTNYNPLQYMLHFSLIQSCEWHWCSVNFMPFYNSRARTFAKQRWAAGPSQSFLWMSIVWQTGGWLR